MIQRSGCFTLCSIYYIHKQDDYTMRKTLIHVYMCTGPVSNAVIYQCFITARL